MEVVQGMADKRELAIFRRTMRAWDATIIYIDREISSKAMLYVEERCLSHSMQLADALIAATAVQCGQPFNAGSRSSQATPAITGSSKNLISRYSVSSS